MSEKTNVEELRELSVFMIAGKFAECSAPDSRTSAGAEFLDSIRTYVIERFADVDEDPADEELTDLSEEIGTAQVPLYTHEMWMTFVDLTAYEEDISFSSESGSLSDAAESALQQLAARCALKMLHALVAGRS